MRQTKKLRLCTIEEDLPVAKYTIGGYHNATVTHFYGHYDNRLTSALKSSRMSI